jgi:hypothetical protein
MIKRHGGTIDEQREHVRRFQTSLRSKAKAGEEHRALGQVRGSRDIYTLTLIVL